MMLLLFLLIPGFGCSREPPGNPLPPAGDRAALERAFAAMAEGHTPTRRPEPAGERGRWEDVDLAIYWAVAQDGVEMAIVERLEYDRGWVYRLKSIEGWPVEFRIERAPGRRVYERAAAVGHFPDRPERRERGRKLEEQFDHFMRELGRKPALPGAE